MRHDQENILYIPPFAEHRYRSNPFNHACRNPCNSSATRLQSEIPFVTIMESGLMPCFFNFLFQSLCRLYISCHFSSESSVSGISATYSTLFTKWSSIACRNEYRLTTSAKYSSPT